LVSLFAFIAEAADAALAEGLEPAAPYAFVASFGVRAAIAALGAACAGAFALAPGRIAAGFVTLASLAILSATHAELYGSPWRHLFFSGTCLLGWLLGLAVSRAAGRPRDESYAYTGAIALLGAAYFNSGASKLAYGGLGWASGTTIQTVVVGHDGLVPDRVVSVARAWVVGTPGAAAFFSLATIVFELAGPLMLVGRRARVFVALGLISMHAAIYVLTDIPYWQSVGLLVTFGVFGRIAQIDDAVVSTHATSKARLGADRRFVVAAVLLAAIGFAAIAYQGWRDGVRSTNVGDERPIVADSLIVPDPITTTQIGPFAVGGTVMAGWVVDRIVLEASAFAVEVVATAGRARFDFSCEPSVYVSPFDVDGAHVFYRSDLDFTTIEPVGLAMRDIAIIAVGNEGVCAAWRGWLQAAR
jgi:hypothetical protein